MIPDSAVDVSLKELLLVNGHKCILTVKSLVCIDLITYTHYVQLLTLLSVHIHVYL